METNTIPGIIKALEVFDGKYKQKEVDEALKQKDEITPHLIEILKKVLGHPREYADEDSDYHGHLYAVILLSHFRETGAHDLIVELFSLPGELPYDLFGDIITEDLPAILYATCGGSLERIKGIALNKEIDEFVRSSALRAMVYAVVGGMISREEVIEFFDSLFPLAAKEKNDVLYTCLANAVCDIYPEELMDKIKDAYKDGCISTFSIELDDFETALAMGKEKTLGLIKKDMERRLSPDIHSRISWWACFRSEEPDPFIPGFAVPQSSSSGVTLTFPSQKKKKKKKKRKR